MCIEIGGRRVGQGQPLFVIAELGLNHGGSLEKALALVDAAATAGASAIKLQTLSADALVAPDCPPPAHVAVASLRDFFRAFELDEASHAAVFARARERGLAVISTPFSEDAVAMLARLGCDALKIASGDITNTRLIERAAATGLPLLVSTGMSDMADVADAVAAAHRGGARQIALLHCVSAYPVPAGSENLRAIGALHRAFSLPVGLSDHSRETLAVPLAIALGASIYERHFVLGEDDDAIDAPVSATPAQLHALVTEARRVAAVLGVEAKACAPAEETNRAGSRRGLYATRDLHPGDVVDEAAFIALRPARGVDARRWRQLVGARVLRPIAAGTCFSDDDFEARHEKRTHVDVA